MSASRNELGATVVSSLDAQLEIEQAKYYGLLKAFSRQQVLFEHLSWFCSDARNTGVRYVHNTRMRHLSNAAPIATALSRVSRAGSSLLNDRLQSFGGHVKELSCCLGLGNSYHNHRMAHRTNSCSFGLKTYHWHIINTDTVQEMAEAADQVLTEKSVALDGVSLHPNLWLFCDRKAAC